MLKMMYTVKANLSGKSNELAVLLLTFFCVTGAAESVCTWLVFQASLIFVTTRKIGLCNALLSRK